MNYRRMIIAVLLLSLLFIIVKYVFPFFAPFIFGLIIAGLIDPEINWIETHWGWPRRYATLIVLTFLITSIIILLLVILGGVYREVNGLIKDLPKISIWNSFLVERLSSLLTDFQRAFPKEILQSITELTRHISGYIAQLSFGLLNIVKSLPNLIGSLIMMVMSSYFFARDKNYWLSLFRRCLPISWIPGFKQVGVDLYHGMLRLIRLESTMMVLSFLMTGLTLSLLGYQRAWTIGIMVGVLEPLPMIGPGAVLLPWAGWSLVTGEWRLAILLLCLACLLMFARQWLELRLLGGELGIHPLFTLIGLYLGLKLFGIVGLIVAPLGISVLRSMMGLLSKKWNFRFEHTF